MMRFLFQRLSSFVESVILAGSENASELQRLRQAALNISGSLFILFMSMFVLLRIFEGRYLIVVLDLVAIGFTILALWIGQRKNFNLGVWMVGAAAVILTFVLLYQGATPPVYRLPQLGLCMVTIMLFFNNGTYRTSFVALCILLLAIGAFSQGGGLFIWLAFLGQMITFALIFACYIYFLERQDTALNRTIKDLKESNQEKNKANQGLNERIEELVVFSHIMGHDLKGPLTTIKGYSELMKLDLKEGHDTDASREYIDAIMDSADAMNSLISDLLTYSKISLADVTAQAVELQGVIAEVEGLLRYQIEQSNAEVQVEQLQPVIGQADMLKTVFYNLVSNAIKFQPINCPEHRPCIRVWSEATGGTVSTFLKDNGVGIAVDYLPNLFTPFRRGPETCYAGTGLGMSICRGILEKFGGTIEVEETSPEGTTFKMTLPHADSTPIPHPPTDPPDTNPGPVG